MPLKHFPAHRSCAVRIAIQTRIPPTLREQERRNAFALSSLDEFFFVLLGEVIQRRAILRVQLSDGFLQPTQVDRVVFVVEMWS
jgi:hypothetical protein